MESVVYSQEGKEVGKIKLPEPVFGVPWNADLVHDAVTSMLSSRRRGTAHTKNRSDVSGGGRKPWRQKGTGRARHGSTRSPIWVGGGVAHGPRKDKDYECKINRKAKARALAAVLSRKFKDGEVLFLDRLSIPSGRTRDAKKVLDTLKKSIGPFGKAALKRSNAALIAFAAKDPLAERSLRNFGNLAVDEVRNLNLLSVLGNKLLVITSPDVSLKELSGRLAV